MGIEVLGPLCVDGVDTLGLRDRIVLQVLTVRAGEVVSTDSLAEAVWGDDPPPTWPKILQGCVVRLRRVLGPETILTSPRGYRLVTAEDVVDAHRFERLVVRARDLLAEGDPDRASYVATEALALWRGQALADLENWGPGRVEAARLGGLRAEAEELRLEGEIVAGRFLAVLDRARTLVAETPFREHRWALYARSLYLAGRQSDALDVLQQARTILRGELGLDPGPELRRLEQAILRQDPSLAASGRGESSGVCPWRGLLPYEADDSETFFGRDADVAACREQVHRHGVLVVVGPSGTGKSSLVRAGVVPALARDGHEVVVTTPGAHPLDSLAAAGPRHGRFPVLVVDQCEEAVTVCHDAGERREYLRALSSYDGLLVVALRADRLTDLVAADPDFARVVENGLHLLAPMSRVNLLEVIEKPARQAGLRLEAGLAELLLREAEDEPGALPLLSHVLRQTWQRREGSTLTVDGYRRTGGVRDAVARSAEALYAQLDDAEREHARTLFLRLVAPGSNGTPVRARVQRRLVVVGPAQERLVENLVAARLVSSGDGDLQIAHESLATHWPRLRAWLDEDVEGQRIFRHLTSEAEAWDAAGRPESDLYRGTRLERAAAWAQRAGSALTTSERDFLEESLRHDARARQAESDLERGRRTSRRRLRVLLGVTATLLATALVAALLVVVQASRTDHARSAAALAARQAAARRVGSLATSETDPSTALLLAAEAVRRDDGDANRAQMLRVLQATPALLASAGPFPVGGRHRFGPGRDEQSFLDVSPDARLVAVGATDRGVEVLTADRLAEVASGGGRPAGLVAFAGTGRIAVAANPLDVMGNHPIASPDPVRLLDVGARPDRVRLGGQVTGVATALDATRDGRFVAVAFARLVSNPRQHTFLVLRRGAGAAPVLVWDLRRPEAPIARVALRSPVRAALLSPDGRRLVTLREDSREVLSFALPSGRVERTRILPGPEVVQTPGLAAQAPDGSVVAVSRGDRVLLLDGTTLATVGTIRAGHAVSGLSFAHAAGLVAAALDTGEVVVWRAASGREVARFRHAATAMWSTAFSRDDATLYASGSDGVRAWDLSGAVGVVRRTDGGPAGFTGTEGSFFLTDEDGQAWLAEACRRAGRNLTREQWSRAFGSQPYRRTCPKYPAG